MNIKVFKNLYDLAELSTCFKADNNKTFSDYLSPTEYGNHEFSITFIRDDKPVETFDFGTKVNEKNVGSLANPEIGLEEKLEYVKEYSPSR